MSKTVPVRLDEESVGRRDAGRDPMRFPAQSDFIVKRLVPVLIAIVVAATAVSGVALAQPGPEFKASFKALADQIPAAAGQPAEEEHPDASGNIVQRTTMGLMVWRRSDRWTVFTNGEITWLLGPFGLQSRANTELYPWEVVPPGPSPLPQPQAPPAGEPASPAPAPATATPPPAIPTPVPPAPVPPTAAPSAPQQTFMPDVKAVDEAAGGHGVMVKEFVQSMDEEWSRVWNWRPRRPTTFYLYMDGARMATDFARMTGAPLAPSDLDRLSVSAAVLRGDDPQTGGYAILQNLGFRMGTEEWVETTRALLLHEYMHVLQTDVAGSAGPTWFREGMAEWTAYYKMWNTPAERSIVAYANSFRNSGTLPTLMTLNSSWSEVIGAGGPNLEAAFGASYLAVKYLVSKVGGGPLLRALERTAAGEDFDAALQAVTGYSIQRLESEYRSAMLSP